eukprot:TRINITY_DN7205_c0_g1_i1.p1 TRINITY_DN7205_c0_g1~~TRINITY_DN7205_c0_g1_i1.p1  ORF type:complete len:318 (+),score=37.31 TRINITY_DN7205_c0_g1_i1:82-954(+)
MARVARLSVKLARLSMPSISSSISHIARASENALPDSSLTQFLPATSFNLMSFSKAQWGDRFFSASSLAASPTSAPSNLSAFEPYNRQRQIMALNHQVPDVAVDSWIAPNAVLIGKVVVEDRAVVWYGSVIRGDINSIRVGAFSSIGEKTVIHAVSHAPTGLSAETDIGKFVVVGSNCSLRSCVLEDNVILGERCVVMEGSIVEKNAMLADMSVVPPGRRIPEGQLWAGNPARYVREVTNDEIVAIKRLSQDLCNQAYDHFEEFLPYSTAYLEAEKLKEALKAKAVTTST